jgi:hypothetical protein
MSSIKSLIGLFLLFISSQCFALRVDSFAISHTDVRLSIRNFGARTIAGSVTHHLKFKVASNFVRLDLKQLQTDSVFEGTRSLTFSQSGESLIIQLGKTVASDDSADITVYYHGTPAADPSGWGGFYFSGDYAFNLGVGFAVYPHTFGRAWLPCVDEFPMKSSYDMYIETDTAYTAACNGVLQSVQNTGTSKIWHYREMVPLSVYLASVSVSKFYVINGNYNGMSSSFPTQLFCKASDSTKVSNSFVNLPDAIRFFEQAFGAQPYSKVGYNMVPFSSGAMEHAGNITYPLLFADGTSNYETLMAHELSHHWWGNQVTCQTVGDMWLNEGWASYCEHLFTEKLRGLIAYKKSILSNHLFVLRYAHINDGQPYSMINIPETITYGNHVYKKGADVVHSLRGVMGDSLFFIACRNYQTQYRLKNASSYDMQNIFAQTGGGAIATDFFNHFVFQPGFPHVIIQKQVHAGSGPFTLTFNTLQKPRFKSTPYTNLPVEVFFFRDRTHYEKRRIVINSEEETFTVTLPFKPVMVCVDYDEKLSDAITDRTVTVGSKGTYDLPETMSKLIVNKVDDSALLRVEHHWVGPEKYITSYPYMSNYRYLSVDGIWNDSLSFDLEMQYDGRKGATSGTGYLDHTLIFKTEDSLTVLYRAFPGDYWREWKDLQFTYGNKNDKQGKVLIKNALKGDYVFAMRDKNLEVNEASVTPLFELYPNPSSSKVEIVLNGDYVNSELTVSNMEGKVVYSTKLISPILSLMLDVSQWQTGTYFVNLKNYSSKLTIVK